MEKEVIPTLPWVKKYQTFLVTDLKLSKSDAAFATVLIVSLLLFHYVFVETEQEIKTGLVVTEQNDTIRFSKGKIIHRYDGETEIRNFELKNGNTQVF